MELDLENKSACIFGMPNSGKSTLTNCILKSFGPMAFIYDTLDEYEAQGEYHSYTPKDRASIVEIERITRAVMKSRRYALYAIDEANRFAEPKPAPLPAFLRDLNDYRAHYELSTLYICRRPVQFHTDIVDLANILIIFRMDGPHDIAYLNNIKAGLGDVASTLPPWHFIVRGAGAENWIVHKPVDIKFKTDKTRATFDKTSIVVDKH
jgi:hypothetical protein